MFFIRFRRDNEGLKSKLMSAKLDGDMPPVIVMDEDVAGACYAPDGRRHAAWTKDGLAIIENQSQKRKIILSANNILPNYRYRGGWLSWSQNQDKIAFSVLNAQIKQDELWIISSDGSNPQSIYSQKSGTIIGPSFAKNPSQNDK
jgi:hypothetical protein